MIWLKRGVLDMNRNKKQQAKKREPSILLITALDILRGVVLAGVFTVFAILVFAFCLKAFSMQSEPIPIINQIIKMLGIFIAVRVAVRRDQKPGVWKGALSGVAYAALGFLFFSLIAGDWGLLPILLSDIALGAICGAVCALLLRLFCRRGSAEKNRR